MNKQQEFMAAMKKEIPASDFLEPNTLFAMPENIMKVQEIAKRVKLDVECNDVPPQTFKKKNYTSLYLNERVFGDETFEKYSPNLFKSP